MTSIRNLLDYIISFSGRGYYPRDRILSAVSDDGVHWLREPGVRIPGGPFSSIEMAYYPCVVFYPEGFYRMYFYGANRKANGWNGGIYSAVSRDGIIWKEDPGLRIFGNEGFLPKAPTILKGTKNRWRMYYSLGNDQESAIRSAVSDDGLVWHKETGVRVSVASHRIIDSSVVSVPNGALRLYFSAVRGRDGYIGSAVSINGLDWQVEKGMRISKQNGMDVVINNPCVINESSGRFRMYFRGGDHSAIGNAIYLASSTDGLTWKVEKKILKPSASSPFERHGLGFPNVTRLENGQWRLFYTGYWGRIWGEKKVIGIWQRTKE